MGRRKGSKNKPKFSPPELEFPCFVSKPVSVRHCLDLPTITPRAYIIINYIH